jgi:hypothetical protein
MKPVAWTDGKGNYFDKTSSFPVDDLIPLYTHPAKTLTKDELKSMWQIAISKAYKEEDGEAYEFFADAILREAQSNCNGFCGVQECKENQANCKRLRK